MKGRAGRVLLALLVLSGLAAAALVLRPVEDRAPNPGTPAVQRGSRHQESPAKLDSIADAIVRTAPFRRGRSAAVVGYDPARTESAIPAESAVPRPALELVGIVWSGSPTALISGAPGLARVWVAARGDTAVGLRLRALTRDQATVAGYDTTWNLRLKELP